MLQFTKKGIYCPEGDFYIDPWRPVDRAVITHAHSDHAKGGSKNYLAHKDSAGILKLRLGSQISLQTVAYLENVHINGVKVSFHPAGHIIGSSQVRVEKNGNIWVASGDYKLQNDGISKPFEPVRCHTFITESTFGLPVYKWEPQEQVFRNINEWWLRNREEGKVSILCGYSLGKAQRLLKNVDAGIGPIYAHGAICNVHTVMRETGAVLPPILHAADPLTRKDYAGSLVIAPPSVGGTSWLKRFGPYSLAVASGWMRVRGNARRRNVDRGFILSDHADWDGLIRAVRATEASQVYVTHGYTSIFARYLNEVGIAAAEVQEEGSW